MRIAKTLYSNGIQPYLTEKKPPMIKAVFS